MSIKKKSIHNFWGGVEWIEWVYWIKAGSVSQVYLGAEVMCAELAGYHWWVGSVQGQEKSADGFET